MTQSYVLILDDDLNFVLEIEMAMANSTLSHQVVDNAEDFIAKLEKRLPEVAVIDLYINGELLGFQCAEVALQHGIPVIFVTAYADEQLVNQAIQYNCYAFINKPINQTTLLATLELARKYQKQVNKSYTIAAGEDNIVFIRNNNRLDRIDLREVAYVSSEGNYCTIFLDSNRKFIAKSSLTQLQSNFFNEYMVRIHRNYIVNLSMIETVNLSEKWVIINSVQLPIGRRFQTDFVNKLRTIK